jgi:hypothetical protein
MAQQQLNGTHVGPGFDQVGRKTVPKRMGCDRFGYAATLTRLLAGLFHRVLGDVAADSITWEEPLLGLLHWPPATQDLEQLWG